uniref:Uncharacterized protein n=1 Tax=Cannabis sativa TaxID=3483 RepID=A0A803PLT2_CANSA
MHSEFATFFCGHDFKDERRCAVGLRMSLRSVRGQVMAGPLSDVDASGPSLPPPPLEHTSRGSSSAFRRHEGLGGIYCLKDKAIPARGPSSEAKNGLDGRLSECRDGREHQPRLLLSLGCRRS